MSNINDQLILDSENIFSEEVNETSKNIENSCANCSKSFSSIYNPISWIVTESRDCFICNKKVCLDCSSESSRYFPETGKDGYVCKNCESKTRTNLKIPFFDVNPIYNILETKIPEIINQANGSIALKLEDIKTSIQEQKDKTKEDVNQIIDNVVKNHLPEIIKMMNTSINTQIYPRILNFFFLMFLGLLLISAATTLEVLWIIKHYG